MPVQPIAPVVDTFDDDDGGWQDMPIVREDKFASGLDEEDMKKYHYVLPEKGKATTANATGAILDVDELGHEWRSKVDQNESEYTRLRVNEEEDVDEVHLRTRYLFDEDKAMTPLSQMQATKNLLTEAQRIAYVGLCALTSREMSRDLKTIGKKELKPAVSSMELWVMKIMGRLYYHMELETAEQKMIDSLAEHGVQAVDLVPALMTTHTVANPEYDPDEARRRAESQREKAFYPDDSDDETINGSISPAKSVPTTPLSQKPETVKASPKVPNAPPKPVQTTAKVLQDTSTATIPGVSTALSSADEKVTLDIRWTVLCDLFLILIADSVYDARSRVLLERVASKLGLGWLDVVKFESRVTEALEIQESIEKMEHQEIIDGRQKANKKKRYMMLGLATLGGGLVIGLSAGLLAPVIGAGLGAAFTTIGITGTTGFLAGAGGAAVITTGGVLTGSGIAVRGMARRTQQVRTFDVLPLHNNKRVNCILTVPGFMTGAQDDVRLPFSVLDPIVGDVFSVLWEPEMIRETGSALKILTGEVLSQIGQTVLQATVMTALMSALQWPIILTKLGYLIDNPWNNALDRAKAAGSVLADILIQRSLGVRPITLIGFSLGARVIFYALLELHRQKAFGIVQDVFLLGGTLSASTKTWCETRSVVSGRYVNGFARNDWVLNYLFRATSGGVGTVAGLRPVENVPGLENVDVTNKISGHMSYRTFMPLILDQLGFPVFADYFDEPVEPDFEGERVVVREEYEPKKQSWFSRQKKQPLTLPRHVSRPPSATTFARRTASSNQLRADSLKDDLPPRMPSTPPHNSGPRAALSSPSSSNLRQDTPDPSTPSTGAADSNLDLPLHAGFDFAAIKEVLGEANLSPDEMQVRNKDGKSYHVPPISSPSHRTESTPPMQRSMPDVTRPSPLSARPSQSDLSSSFSRSLSFGDAPNDSVDDDDISVPPSHSPGRERVPPVSPLSYEPVSFGDMGAGTPRVAPPVFTFGEDDRSFWAPPSVPTKDSSIGASSIGTLSTPFGRGSSTHDPFATSPVISFGAVDGSISTTSPINDPWSIPSDIGRGKSKDNGNGLNTNPWS